MHEIIPRERLASLTALGLVTSLDNLGTRVIRDAPGEAVRYEKRKREWPLDNAKMINIETEFPLLFPEKGENFITARFESTGRPQILLDWGCGKGLAAEDFGEHYGGKVISLGYSADSYDEWKDAKNSVFIQSTADDLFEELDKRKIALDLLYSRVGLVYLFPGASRTEEVPMERGVKYIRKLIHHMNEGGVIGFDVGKPGAEEICRALRQELGDEAEVILEEQDYGGDAQIYVRKLSQRDKSGHVSVNSLFPPA